MPNLDATGHRWVGALASFQDEPGGKSSGGKTGVYAHSRLGTDPRGRCCPSHVP